MSYEHAAQTLRKLADPVLKAAEVLESAHAAEQAAREARERQAASLTAAQEAEAKVAVAEARVVEINAKLEAQSSAAKLEAAQRRAALGHELESKRCKAADAVRAEIDKLEKDRKELADKIPGLKAEVVALATERDRLKKAVDTLKSAIAGV